jgi:hypothetical protein
MKIDKKHEYEIWCQLMMSKESELSVHTFFIKHYYIDPNHLIYNMHLTVYHSRRPMLDLEEMKFNCMHNIDTNETRFMVLTSGGENQRPDIIPGYRKVGIRIQRSSNFRNIIHSYRRKVIQYEDIVTLGERKPSNMNRNAFGSRSFQPHISLLKAGSEINFDLYSVGENFRNYISELVFNKYIIRRVKVR